MQYERYLEKQGYNRKAVQKKVEELSKILKMRNFRTNSCEESTLAKKIIRLTC